jgi:hypothetical protein
MQVSHVDERVTHAVIGGRKTIDFDISNSAEFFHILSSTLYTDQRLAVIREVVCNAWDAHIASGRTNLPVEVILENNQITIRDFGNGIADEDMGHIYGTYGNSTKQNDGKQTGGFGLGCKAPFAYTDHFQVVSHHKGVKTIYALSKSSAVVGGKPGITPIVSMPTDDFGLSRREEAVNLMGEYHHNPTEENYQALLNLKKTAKVSWEKLGLDEPLAVEKMLSKQKKAPKQPVVKSKPDAASSPLSNRDQVLGLLPVSTVEDALTILEIKRRCKKSWLDLGVSEANKEAIMELVSQGK